MLKQHKVVSARRRRSASISLVLIASTTIVAGCGQRVSAGDVAYRNSFRNAGDCRRDYGNDCTMAATPGGGVRFYGPYLVNSGSRPTASPSSMGVESSVLNAETASSINSGHSAARGGFTARGGFGGFGGEGGGHGGGGGE